MSGLIIDSEACIGCGRCEDVCWHQGIEIKERKAYKTDKCIGCGKCALSCPVNGIDIVERRPHWNGACTHCMACICGCPVSAIEYGHKSQGKPRYQCPEYK